MKRLFSVILLLLLAATAARAQEARVNWSGEWRSFWRDGQALMTLEQLGNRVAGSYTPGDGRIEATVDGRVLTGAWREKDGEGVFTFALSRDGDSFAGRFGNGEYWNGERLDENRASPTPFGRSDTPRETLRTVIAAANATAEGQSDATLIWGPLLHYEADDDDSNRRRSQRRQLFIRLLDMMTFRINDAPAAGENGAARFSVGPAGSQWRIDIRFVEVEPDHWRMVLPPRAEIEAALGSALQALGFEEYAAYGAARRNHPRAVMRDFLNGVAQWESDGRERALATLDMSDISPQLQSIEGPLAADFLRQIIDRVGYVIWQEIPDNPDQATPYVHYAHALGEIAIAPQRDADGAVRWMFSRETLQAAPAIYEAIQSLPVAEGLQEPRPFSDFFRLRRAVYAVSPALIERRFLLETWQWLALGAIFLSLGALAWGLGRVTRPAVGALCALSGSEPEVRAEMKANFVWPLRLILLGAGLRAAIGELGLRRDFLEALGTLGVLSLVLGLSWLAYRLVGLVGGYFMRKAAGTKTYIDDIVASLVTGLMKVAVAVSAIIALAEAVGLPYEGVIAGLGVGGLALAIAARDTVSNFFGAAILLADRPFKRGDVVEVGDRLAIIESVGLRSTRLRTLEDSQLMIPNGKLADQTINNLGKRRQFRVALEIGVVYDTPRDRLDAFVDALRQVFRDQPRAIPDPVYVGLKGFGDSAITIEVIGNFKVASFDLFVAARHRLIADIVSRAEAMDVSFAFPTRTLHLAAPASLSGPSAAARQAAEIAQATGQATAG